MSSLTSLFEENLETVQRTRVADNLATLHALLAVGPLEDGDVPSKAERDNLLRYSLAQRVIVKGQDGYTAATYQGARHFTKYMAYRAAVTGKPTPSTLVEALALYASLT